MKFVVFSLFLFNNAIFQICLSNKNIKAHVPKKNYEFPTNYYIVYRHVCSINELRQKVFYSFPRVIYDLCRYEMYFQLEI